MGGRASARLTLFSKSALFAPITDFNALLRRKKTCGNLAVFGVVRLTVTTVERRNVQAHVLVQHAVSIQSVLAAVVVAACDEDQR